MNKNTKQTQDRKESYARMPNDSFNANLDALPKDTGSAEEALENPDIGTQMEYGDMNLQDAKASGYTDEKGHAISKAKPDVAGSPTGAYTDVGVGRSSAVHKVNRKTDSESHH